MASIGESNDPKAGSRGSASGFVWVSSSPTPAEVADLVGRFPEVVRIDSARLEESSSCWKNQAILARTFQRWVPPDAFLREFRRAGVPGVIHPLSLAHCCHIFRFEDPGAKELVIGRPWVINGQPVAIEAWRPEFVPSSEAVASALLWVRLPSLPVEFWTEEVLREILLPAGEFVFADSATCQLSRGVTPGLASGLISGVLSGRAFEFRELVPPFGSRFNLRTWMASARFVVQSTCLGPALCLPQLRRLSSLLRQGLALGLG